MPDAAQHPDDLLSALPPAQARSGGEPFETAVATYLEATLAARSVPVVIGSLRDAGLLDPETLAVSELSEIVEAVRGSGLVANAKRLAPLRGLARWWMEHGGAGENASTASLRESLAACPGIGQRTADAILLDALLRPVMPVSRAVYRVLVRHGWIDSSADYDEAAEAARGLVGDEAARLARFSQGLEWVGAKFCRVSQARCQGCPLQPWLPEGGPREPF